jgi:hypothetical protein
MTSDRNYKPASRSGVSFLSIHEQRGSEGQSDHAVQEEWRRDDWSRPGVAPPDLELQSPPRTQTSSVISYIARCGSQSSMSSTVDAPPESACSSHPSAAQADPTSRLAVAA